MHQKVFILGASGNVGSTLVRQIAEHDQDGTKNVNPTHIIGMANSKYVVFHDRGFSKKLLLTLKDKESIKSFLEEKGKRYENSETILEELKKLGYFGEVIIVDATADKNIIDFHYKVLSEKYRYKLVTANKNPASLGSQAVFDALTLHHGIYDYNTAVMA